MDNSLSIILPVYNSERSLAGQVARLLDLLPDLTHRFEVLIVDDGSTDHTRDVAAELSREYPQLRVAAHARRQGLASAVRTGMQQAHGDVVLVQEPDAPLSARELRRLWKLRSAQAATSGHGIPQPKSLKSDVIDRLSAWGESLVASRSQPAESPYQPEYSEPDFADVSASEHNRTDIPHSARKSIPARGFLKQLRDLTIGE